MHNWSRIYNWYHDQSVINTQIYLYVVIVISINNYYQDEWIGEVALDDWLTWHVTRIGRMILAEFYHWDTN